MIPPSSPRGIKADIDRLLSTLIEQGIADDQNFPVLRQLSADGWEVSFSGAEYISIALGDIDYSDVHKELSAQRSYNVKLIDGGLLQMMYRFEGERLAKHRLAYFPSPDLRPFLEDPEAYLRDEQFIEIVSRRIVPFPIRFDFDHSAAQDVDHPSCHLTLGDFDGCRIPVSAPLTPRWFVEFVVRNFYQLGDYRFADRLPDHRCTFSACITKNEARMIHIAVPY
jgi:hypothetical protein